MTVTIRPVPKRTYQNGIRPFRPVVPTNNIRPYTLKTWRPPVPEPLPPAPLLGPKELLGLGALVLAQIWGWLSSRPKGSPPQGSPETWEATGKVGSGGGSVLIRITAAQLQRSCTVNSSTKCYGPQIVQTQASAVRTYTAGGGGVVSAQLSGFRVCGYNTALVKLAKAEDPAAGTVDGSFISSVGTPACGDIVSYSVRLEYTSPIGQQTDPVLPVYPIELPGWAPPQVPQIPTTPLPRTPVVPLPVEPSIQPIPQVEPSVVPTTPGPAAPPATTPRVPRRTVPLPTPGATPTKDGAIVPQAPATVAVTPPDAHFPVPGAPPVTGNGPRPTPEGIAQELGRLEQKLARLSDPGPEGPGDGSDRLQLISDLIGRLIEFATSMTAGGGYGLSSPCEVDENGERIVTTVNYPGATNSLGVLGNKVDALAALIQVHKDLKQPNCKQAPAVGQPVTVNFVQVD